MSEPGAGVGRRRQDWRREQRRIARAYHPDLGGDPEQYLRLLREVDLRFGVGPRPGRTDPVCPVPPRQALIVIGSRRGARLRQGLRVSGQVVRALRARLPQALPGSRRYLTL